MFKRLLRIPPSARWGVLAFLVLVLILWSVKSRGEELIFSGGSTVVRGYAPLIGVDVRWPEAGPVRTDYEIGMRLIGESRYRQESQSNQIALHATLVDGWKWFRAGLGIAYLTNTDVYNGKNVNFRLMVGLVPLERVSFTYEHYSCAGSCSPNLGRDMVLLGWRF